LVYQTAGIAPWNEDDDEGELTEGEVQDAWIQVNRNLYGAIGNNPISLTDAFGLSPSLNPQNQVWACEAVETAGQAAARNVARNIAREALQTSRSQATKAIRAAMNPKPGFSPHHKLPWKAAKDNPLMKKAAEGGWNLNGANNGVNLPSQLHNGWKNWNAWHKYVNELGKRALDKAWKKNPNMSSEQAAAEAQRIADWLGRIAENARRAP